MKFTIKPYYFQKCKNDKAPNEKDSCNKLTDLEAMPSSSPDVIESTPEKLEDNSKTCNVDLNGTGNIDKMDSQNVKFLPVNQFRLKNDNERTMCIKQQKNSWLQLNDSKKDFESVMEKSSTAGSLSILKRDREERDGEKRVKRKISDYFSPKS